jgi:carboxypeptidase C (cathepsin A)
VYDHLPWRRQASYRQHKFKDWQWPDESGALTTGGEIKATNDLDVANKLAFVSVNEAGHASPGDQKEAVTWLIKCWTGAGKHDSRCPF